jgi:hypothetical protein
MGGSADVAPFVEGIVSNQKKAKPAEEEGRAGGLRLLKSKEQINDDYYQKIQRRKPSPKTGPFPGRRLPQEGTGP